MSKSLSLRWLEVFQLIAKSGSIQQVASETDLSISTVSNHLRSLERALGIELVDHGRRPMGLTPAGEVFARYVRNDSEGAWAALETESLVPYRNWAASGFFRGLEGHEELLRYGQKWKGTSNVWYGRPPGLQAVESR